MKALLYNFKSPQLFEWENSYPSGIAKKKEIAVKVLGVGLNPLDYKLPQISMLRTGRDKTPAGAEFSGEVVEIGPGVKDFSVGDLVWGFAHKGALTERMIVSEKVVCKIPSACDAVTASGWAVCSLTAYQGLLAGKCIGSKTPVKVLVIGASGGVGHMVVQLAKVCNPVGSKIIAVCSGKNSEFVKSIGADQVLDYTEIGFDLAAAVKDCDMVFDCVTPDFDYEPVAKQCLKKGGLYVVANSDKGWDFLRAGIQFALGLKCERKNFHLVFVQPEKNQMSHLAELFASGKLKLHVSKTIPFIGNEVVTAIESIKTNRTVGKLIVKM